MHRLFFLLISLQKTALIIITDQIQGDDLSDASEVASSRAPSKQKSSQKYLSMLVRNLQKEVENLKSTSQAHPVDELSALNLHELSALNFHQSPKLLLSLEP